MKDRGYTGFAGAGPTPLKKEEAKKEIVEEVKEEASQEEEEITSELFNSECEE